MDKNKLLRVTQINAIYLDNEIYKLFIQIIQDASKHLPPGFVAPYDSEIRLLVKLAILNYSIMSSGSTFGQQLLSIKYDNITIVKKLLYLICNSLEYVKNKFEFHNPSHSLNSTFANLYIWIKLLDLLNLSIFLRNGVKPLLIERVLSLNQVYTRDNIQRQFESKYLARELLWNGFIEILVNVLPLINIYKLKRGIKYINPFYQRPNHVVITDRTMTSNTKCVHCGDNPILPHHMGCQHIFCYVCLKGNQAADSKYECPVCEHRNPNILCDRVSVM